MCDTFFNCFLTILNVGFISGSVDFSVILSISEPRYWIHFIYSWSFYFIIVIIMINIINAIIVDSFQGFREKNNERTFVMYNVCYVCSFDKTKFDLIGYDFWTHLMMEHNITNYLKYLVRLKLINKNDLNYVESYVLDCFSKDKTTFFPIQKSITLIENAEKNLMEN